MFLCGSGNIQKSCHARTVMVQGVKLVTKVFRWDGLEIFIDLNHMIAVYFDSVTNQTNALMVDGTILNLSAASYELVTGQETKRAGF